MAEKTNYQAAAIAALEAMPEDGNAAETPEAPAPEAKATEEETPVADSVADSAKAEVPEKTSEKVEPPKKSFADLAKEKADARARKAQADAQEAELREARALIEFARKGDAVGLLTAAKIPWSKAASQVLGGKTEEEPEKPAPDTEIAKLREELNGFKEEARQARNAAKLAEVRAQAADLVKKGGDKYLFVAEHDAAADAVDFVRQYYSETGELPGETLEESLQIGLEAVEADLAKKADKWEKALAKKKGVVTNTTKQEVTSVAASKKAAQTLTNNTASGPRTGETAKKAKSELDYRKAAEALVLDEAD